VKLNKIHNILFFIICIQSFSQTKVTDNQSFKIKLIENVKNYCIDTLGMDISTYFYSKWAKSEKSNYYLYVSEKTNISSHLKGARPYKAFGHNFKGAEIEKNKYAKLGFSTLLYQTYGTAATKLSNYFLSYSKESIAFIAFHEATHQHISKNAKIPYSITEAACDIVGNYGTLKLFNENKSLSKRKAKKHIKQIEAIAIEINKLLNNHSIDYSILDRKIDKLKRNKSKFNVDRYDFEVNKAYLLRNRSYTYYYFKLKQLLYLTNDLKIFLAFIVELPNDEIESVKEINKKINTLSQSSIF
jgi:hypothetical protein